MSEAHKHDLTAASQAACPVCRDRAELKRYKTRREVIGRAHIRALRRQAGEPWTGEGIETLLDSHEALRGAIEEAVLLHDDDPSLSPGRAGEVCWCRPLREAIGTE